MTGLLTGAVVSGSNKGDFQDNQITASDSTVRTSSKWSSVGVAKTKSRMSLDFSRVEVKASDGEPKNYY